MKADIETLKDTFKIGYDLYFDSRVEAEEIWNMFHNRQYTLEQENILENRGQPKETFNVIKLFARMVLGYYSTVINSISVLPVQQNDIETAFLLNDVVENILDNNDFAEKKPAHFCKAADEIICFNTCGLEFTNILWFAEII